MARSRNYQKSRKFIDLCNERKRLRRLHDDAVERDVERVLIEGHYRPEPMTHIAPNPVKRMWFPERNLLIMLTGETAHVMPARG